VALLAKDLLQGTPDEITALQEAFSQLQTAEIGKTLADAVQENQTAIKFGSTTTQAVAQFDPAANTITIHERLKKASPAILAAHLAHEGTHARFGSKSNSIDEEYQAFKAQAEVWDELKGNQSDDQCDAVSNLIAKGERYAKREIRRLYRGLPEY